MKRYGGKMKFDADQYFRAATERMKQARLLYRQRDSDCYALAMYMAGVAVECLLRAFKNLHTDDLDERHDLQQLFRGSKMLDSNEKFMTDRHLSDRVLRSAQEIRACMNEICVLWANDYRYASESRLKSELASRRLRGMKGDVLKASANRLVNAGERLVEQGAIIWASLRRR